MQQTLRALSRAILTRTPVLVTPKTAVINLFGERMSEEVSYFFIIFIYFLHSVLVAKCLCKNWCVFVYQLSSRYCVIFVDQVSRIKLVLPGSFNPLHAAHVQVLQKASAVASLPDSSINDGVSVFEISVANADKGIIDESQLFTRVRDIVATGASLVVTGEEKTFVAKAEVSRGHVVTIFCLLSQTECSRGMIFVFMCYLSGTLALVHTRPDSAWPTVCGWV